MVNKISIFNEAINAGFAESEALEYAGIKNYKIVLEQDTTDGYFDCIWVSTGDIYADLNVAITEATKIEGRVVDNPYQPLWTSPKAPDALKKIT